MTWNITRETCEEFLYCLCKDSLGSYIQKYRKFTGSSTSYDPDECLYQEDNDPYIASVHF